MNSTDAISQGAVIVKILIDLVRGVVELGSGQTRALAFVLGVVRCMIVMEGWEKNNVVEKILAGASTGAGAIGVNEATQKITKSITGGDKSTVEPVSSAMILEEPVGDLGKEGVETGL